MNDVSGLTELIEILGEMVFWYPYLMSILWITGGLIFVYYREKKGELKLNDYEWPGISILLPCYNEESTVEETLKNLSKLSYPKMEIIAVNDGSSDNTGKILKQLSKKYKKLRVIDCHENKGKANALHMAAHASRNEYLLCIDSDAILDDMAPYYLIKQFLDHGERVGAVTGNPRIRNRDTLLGKIQLVEYASIIGLIKRTQRVFGKVMTVSGVIVAYRKKALMSVDLWDRDIITEDIAVSWKLQRRFWDIRYEPKALCWMLVPETLKGLWKQRVRWAQGGQEIMIRHYNIFKDWKQRRLWPIYLEQVLSILWSFLWIAITIFYIFNAKSRHDLLLSFTFSAFALAMLSFIQLFISMKHESTYDNIMKYYIWAAWYPIIYWIINAFVTVYSLPKAIKSSRNRDYATWKSPDRGEIRKSSDNSKTFIVKSQKNIIMKVLEVAVTIIMWSYMFMVIYLFISAACNHNDIFISIVKDSIKITNRDIRNVIYTSIKLFIISFAILYLWKIYNLKRFGKLDRRKYPKNTTSKEMISLNLVDAKVYDMLQREQIIEFTHNPIKEMDEVNI